MLIRHSVFFVYKDDIDDDQRLRIKEGMSYISFFSDIAALDYGEDLGVGRPDNHSLALMHDHVDRAHWDAYNKDPHHHRVGDYIKTVSDTDRVARVDWEYSGPDSRKGMIRHGAMYWWRDDTDEDQKRSAREAFEALRSACPTVRFLAANDDLGWYPPNHHWIVEAHFDDVDGLKAFLDHPAYVEAETLIDGLTEAGKTARIQHRMLSG